MTDTPLFNSDVFTWKGNQGTATLRALGLSEFPRQGFRIQSMRSSDIRMFEPDIETMEANEFFDGEASAYVSGSFKVQIWL